MLINTTVSTHSNVIILKKAEYDLLREKATLFNEVCAIHRAKLRGEFKYESDYKEAMGYLLDELVKADMPAKEEADE